MTREELLKHLEETLRLLSEVVETDELTDFAREQAYICVMGALQYVRENFEG